jgi:type IV fimbrial biogenesis protein FimT
VGISQEGYQPQRSAGFTLLESIIALVVAAVVMAIAVPAMGRMLARYQVSTAQLDLIATLQHARSLAKTSGRPKLFCPSLDGRRCASITHWERGWTIGNYRSGHADQLDGSPLLVNGGNPHVAMHITSDRKTIRFQPTGTAGGSPVTFTLCRQGHAEDALALTVSNVGRVASAKAKAADAALCAASN